MLEMAVYRKWSYISKKTEKITISNTKYQISITRNMYLSDMP